MNKIEAAQLKWNESNQPESIHFGDIYFSRQSGPEETHYLFINHNQLKTRFAQIATENALFTIGETGFGTGLNFLCTAHTFLKYAPPHARLHFISCEKYPLTKADLERATAQWPEFKQLTAELLSQYPPHFPGYYTLSFTNHRIRLSLLLGDAKEQLSTLAGGHIDAWFLDGFAPSKNPELWGEPLLKEVARLSKKGTTFSTFTAASQVRQTLTQLGFCVSKDNGFANKREMLYGIWPHEAQHRGIKSYFQLPQHNQRKPQHAIIVGAGLAGCTTAWSLAQRNWSVTLLDKNSAIAQESSGNLQGILYARLSAYNNTPNRFQVQSYLHTLRLLKTLYRQPLLNHWSACGVLQLAFNSKEEKRWKELAASNIYPPSILQTIDANTASQLAGATIKNNCIYFPQGGWVNPPSFCATLINHPLITLQNKVDVQKLHFDETEQQWHLSNNNTLVAKASTVIIANNVQATQFDQTRSLPTKLIRGQVTHLPKSRDSEKLRAVVCTERYLTPSRDSIHCLGASFNLHELTPTIREEDHLSNLAALSSYFPELYDSFITKNDQSRLDGRVGFRTVTPDYMPIVGPVPVESQFMLDFQALRHNAHALFEKQGTFFPGLFINTAHGSRGLLTCPLSAELLAAYITGEIFPVENEVAELLHPARFIVKDLIRRVR